MNRYNSFLVFSIISFFIQSTSFRGRCFETIRFYKRQIRHKRYATTPFQDNVNDVIVNDVIVNVNLSERAYPIYINEGLLKREDLLQHHLKAMKALIVTNTKVGPLYTETVKKVLKSIKVESNVIILPDGEEYKSIETLMKIIDAALEHKLDRASVFIALGGGVVGDMTGFAASIYQRGVSFIQLPTSLMAMVDSAVGGKTAVNHRLGKNMIGTFHQPQSVIIDTTTLNTLPHREFISGLSEVMKYGIIHDKVFFEWLEVHAEDLRARNTPQYITYMIEQSCINKAQIVALDEKEAVIDSQRKSGSSRAALNLGHTFGHAIENGVGYGVWLHGEAVSVGIVMAADFSYRMGRISKDMVLRIVTLLKAFHLPTTLYDNTHAVSHFGSLEAYQQIVHATLQGGKFRELISLDKKVSNGALHLVLLDKELGTVTVTNEYDEKILNEMIEEYVNNTIRWG